MLEGLSASDARRILKALGKGATPAEFAHHLMVGQENWFAAAKRQMAETAEDHDFEVRFVRARYGGGKTHFLRCLEQAAISNGWATSYVLLKRDLVELDQFGTFVTEVARTVDLPSGGRGASALITLALQKIACKAGYREGQALPLVVHERAQNMIAKTCREQGFGHAISLALQAAMNAFLDRDIHLLAQICEWCGGGASAIIIDPSRLAAVGGAGKTYARPEKLKPMGGSGAEDLLKLLAVCCRMGEHTGLYIGVDELELIGRLPVRRKANSFQTLRALVDQNDSSRLPPSTCIYLAATPEMFEDPDKFPSYKALQDRIENAPSLGGAQSINYRANVIDLDKTQLESKDLLKLGQAVLELYQLSGQAVADGLEGGIASIVKQIVAGGYVMARPRLLCKCVTDLLNGTLGTDLSKEIALRVKVLQEEREKELSGE
jgi:BREX system ATP-binding protein BrxC/D